MIRPAAPTDATALAAIWNPLIRDTTITFTSEEKSVATLADMLGAAGASGRGAFVAETGDGVAGFALYGRFRRGPGYRYTVEHTVVISPGSRRRGLGGALMARLIADAADAGLHVMVGAVSGENTAAIAFHRALGFSDEAVLRGVGWKFGRPLDLHLMARTCRP